MADAKSYPTLQEQINYLEKAKFIEQIEDGTDVIAIRTTAKGEFTPSGLQTGGKVTEITINDTEWLALPTTPRLNRNAMSIQNRSGGEMKVNYVDDVGYVGIVIPDGGERYYDIKDSIILYGRAQSGSLTVNIEEIA